MLKKILFIVTQSEFGGAQRYVFEVAAHLASHQYEILVAAGQKNGELFEKLKNTQVEPVYLKHMRRAPLPWQIFLCVREIFTLLKKEKPDVLFLCSTTAGFLGSIAGFLYKINHLSLTVIYRIGGWAFNDPRPFWQNKIILWLEKLTARFKDKIIVNSEIDYQLAIKRKISAKEKLVKIYNGIDVAQLNFLSKEQACKKLLSSTSPGLVVIGCVANFYKTKGLKYLIEAIHILNTAARTGLGAGFGDAKYIIIGDGKERANLEQLIKKYKLGNIVLLPGQIPDAYRYLKAFDIFVLPSVKEGFPWIILEAMAAELPIIATKVGALPEIIEDKKSGFLKEPKNPRIIAEKILWLLKNPEQARNMEIQAKQKVKKEFTLEKMLQQTEQLLSDR
jgi:glycosyltransferase involved in cell wall biosynthesis